MVNVRDVLKDIFTQFINQFRGDCTINVIGSKNEIKLEVNTCLLGYQVKKLERTSLGGSNFRLKRTYRIPIQLWTPLETPLNHAELTDKFQNFFLVTDFSGVNEAEASGFDVYQDPSRPLVYSQMDYSFSLTHNSSELQLKPSLNTLAKNIIQPAFDTLLRDELNDPLQDENNDNLEREEDA